MQVCEIIGFKSLTLKMFYVFGALGYPIFYLELCKEGGQEKLKRYYAK